MSNVAVILGSLVLPLLFGWFVPSFWLAVILCTVALSALLHIASWIGAGYVDPFYPISIAISLIVFLCWSAAIIAALQKARRARQSDRAASNAPCE